MEDLSDKTGEKHYQRPENITVNEIRLNGETGKFQYMNILNRKPKEKIEPTELGNSIDVIFLKIRRRLQYYSNNQKRFVTTTEHNYKDDTVFLFGPNIKGVASVLREQYEQLRTHQIVYCLYKKEPGSDPEIIRLIVKGASLGSENKAKDTVDFYSYLQSFGKDEHSYQYVTNITTVKEKGVKDYYCMNFNKGTKLPESIIKDTVSPKIEMLHGFTQAQDEYYNTKSEQKIVEDETPKEDTIEYPEEDIDPESIPF